MLKSFIHKIFLFATLALSVFSPTFVCATHSIYDRCEVSYAEEIKKAPLILGNHDLLENSLRKSAYDLLTVAKKSILIISFTFSEPHVIDIINQKASEGLEVELIVDRDHLNFKNLLHPSIKVNTRKVGEGHLHHKILVVDREFVWLGSGNFTSNAFEQTKNLAVAFYSFEVASQLHQEALDITLSNSRLFPTIYSSLCGNQLLELYVLPHHSPGSQESMESAINELGQQKLISLIDNAKHHLKICVDVWTYKDASRAVINAMKRGVEVDVVVGSLAEDAVKMLAKAGVNVKKGDHLHYKFMLVDHEVLLNGSLNWSMNAFSRNDESFIVLYQISSEQMSHIENVLKVAGLPLDRHYNKHSQQAFGLFDGDEFNSKELVNRTIGLLKTELSNVPMNPEDERLHAIAKRLLKDLNKFKANQVESSVPGCCLYEGENYLANVVAIAEKQERVQDAIKYIKNANGIDQKVSDYFQRTLNKLRNGVNVPLPDYFHATREGLESIIESHHIIQSTTGYTGPGTYISCNNEGNFGYGSHTFAIDESVLVNTQATFRTGRHPVTNVFYSLWAAVLKDISINESSIAFIDTSINDIEYVEQLLLEQGLNIEVLDRKSAETVLRIFDLTTKRRELPSFFWNKFDPEDYLPQNMYPRSKEGTFRKFVFETAL